MLKNRRAKKPIGKKNDFTIGDFAILPLSNFAFKENLIN
jgi:hypothetical protein